MKPCTCLVILVVAAGALGCRTPARNVWPGVPEDIRARLRTVRIEYAIRESRPFLFSLPETKSDAMGEAAMVGAFSWVNACDARAAAVGLFFSPVTAGVGAIYGACAGVPSRELEVAVMAITNAEASMALADHLPMLLVRKAASRTAQPVLLQDEAAGTDAPVTTLRIRIVTQQLSGSHGYNPSLGLHLVAQVTLLDERSRHEFHSFYVELLSERRKFMRWGDHDAALFRAEFERLQDQLADEIVDRVFLGEPPPMRQPGFVR